MQEAAFTPSASTAVPAAIRPARPTTPSPVYKALRSKVLRFNYGSRPVAVAFEHGPRSKRPQVKAVVVTSLTPEVQEWCAQLAQDMVADSNSEKKNRRYAHILGADCLEIDHLKTLGQWVGSDEDEEEKEDEDEDLQDIVIYSGDLLVVLLDTTGGRAIGFAGAEIAWFVNKIRNERQPAEIEIDVEVAWIAPEYRGKGHSNLLASALNDAVLRTIRLAQEKSVWPDCGRPEKLAVKFCGDVVSSSGKQFLKNCANTFCYRAEYGKETMFNRFKFVRVSIDARI